MSAWRSNRWLKPASGLAIAASVALLAIVVTAPQPGTAPGDAVLSESTAQPFVSPNILPLAPVSQPASFTPSRKPEADRLNAYLLRHNQMAGTTGRQGFVSFVPIVATQASAPVNADEKDQKTTDTDLEQEAAANK